jgi:hypothetical protein
MNGRQRRKKPAILPFLLLVFAWCCASISQTRSFSVTRWAVGARHFSHQQQLKADVAFLLAGQKTKAALAGARTPPPAQPAAPSSGETVTKRSDMAASGDPAAWLVRPESESFSALEALPLPDERAEPLQPPPRASFQA